MADSHRCLIQVRRNEDGSLDEIRADGCDVHLEQMDEDRWWLAIEKDGCRQVVWFTTKEGGVESEMDCVPPPVK